MLLFLVEIGDKRLELFVSRRSEVEGVWPAARSWGIFWSFAAGLVLITGAARAQPAAQPVETQTEALSRGRGAICCAVRSLARRSAAAASHTAGERRGDRCDPQRIRIAAGRNLDRAQPRIPDRRSSHRVRAGRGPLGRGRADRLQDRRQSHTRAGDRGDARAPDRPSLRAARRARRGLRPAHRRSRFAGAQCGRSEIRAGRDPSPRRAAGRGAGARGRQRSSRTKHGRRRRRLCRRAKPTGIASAAPPPSS